MTMSIAAAVHRRDELGRALRRPDRVGGDDRGARLGKQLGDLVRDAFDPGAAGDEAVLRAALGAGRGRGHDVPAMMAGEAPHQPVLDHPRGAIGALEAVAAVAAQGQRREAAAVEEQQRLLAALEVRLQLLHQHRGQPAAARRRVQGEVDRPDVGQRRAGEPLGQSDLAVAAERDHVLAFDRRGGRRQDHRNVLEPGAHHGGVAGVILDPVLLLEARLVGLVDHDQAEVGVGEEQGRARADRDPRFAAGDAAPVAPPLRRAQARMPGDGRAAEACLEALEERLGQGDLGQQDKRLPALAQAFGDRLEIDFGLARAGDPVEQDRVEPVADRRGEAGGAVALVGVEVRRRELGVGDGQRPVGVDRHGFERPGLGQPAHHRIAHPGMVGELADRALATGQRGQRRFTLRGQAVGDQPGRPIFDQLARTFERRR